LRIYEDLRAVQARIGLLQALALALVALLLGYFWYLQVLRGRYYRDLAENNRIRTIAIAAPRGRLLDRHGRLLVENRASFNVVLNPEDSEDLDRALDRLGQLLHAAEAPIREQISRRGQLHAVTVKADATLTEVTALEARRLELPEASVEVIPLRAYPLATAAAHALGRVGEVTERQLRSPEFEGLGPGALVGQAGLELRYNHELMGRDGQRRVVVNSRGVEVAEAGRENPVEGPNLTLSLDAELQRVMDQALQGRSGGAVALDPRTGEVLAMTSLPSYDPNEFSTGIDPATWGRLASDPETPLMNRVIQGQYAPGSVFKIVMATAALEEGVISRSTTFYCPGYLTLYNTSFRCAKPSGHGFMNVVQALTHSCNVFFFQVGVRLEVERIARYARLFGLGARSGIDLPSEASGLVPDSAWKLRVHRLPWFPGETVSVAIGQGQTSTTPLQLARVVSVIANGGKLVAPHLLRAIGSSAVEAPAPRDLGLRPETLELVSEGLCGVVNEGGSGRRARLPNVRVCGKTGTAQVVSHDRLVRGVSADLQPHGWFVAYAPAEAPRIALAVLVENGGSGPETAAPVARQILEHFFAGEAEPRTAVAEASLRR
jgi:penicillin-binding protein 2